MSIGTPIDEVGSGGFEVTGQGGTGGNFATDKGRGWAEMVLSGAEEAECDMD